MDSIALSAEEAYLASSHKWNEEINFEEIDEDLANFQEDELVQQALHRGVDLDKYGKELERDLRQVRYVVGILVVKLFPTHCMMIISSG